MSRWMRVLAAVLLAGAARPGGADAWQWALERTLSSPSPTSTQGNNLGFGSALAALGNTLLVGNPVATDGPLALGAGYLVDPSTGAILQTFYSPNATTCFFGATVAAAGGAAWVGTSTGEVLGCRPQHFLFDSTNGTVLNTINDPLPQPNDQTFGESVASAGGNRVLTGDQYDLGIQGVGYLIDLGSPGGALVHAFQNPVPNTVYFGERVAAAGNALAIAAPAQHVTLYDATTFVRLWTKLRPSPSEIYGEYLAADATHLAVGSPSVQAPPGHAYLYDHGGALVTTMTDPVLGSTNFFGEAVVLGSSQVIVSDPDEVAGAPVAGAVYVFDRTTGNLLQTIANPAPQSHDFFGNSMVAVGSLLAVGAEHAGPQQQRGLVYIYAPCGDGIVDPGEDCDDGNTDPGDGCDPNCRLPGCGNGYRDVAAGEACDDGNVAAGDCCSPTCTLDSAGTPCGPFGHCSAGGTCVGIPTLGEWGVLIGSLLMLAAVLFQHRRRGA